MRIACPRCEATYRIDPLRLPAPRVRAACLMCGEPLFLRLVQGGRDEAPSAAPAREPTLARADEVPMWSDPSRAERGAVAETSPAGAEPAAERPLEPFLAPAAGTPFVQPATSPEPPTLEPFAERAPVEARAHPLEPLPAPRPPEAVRPLEPFIAPAPVAPETKPLAPYLEKPRAAPAGAARPAAFTFSQVGDVAARSQQLARALVSDILVYQPKKVEQAVREGNLKDAMKEEVEKSWEEYCERLGPDVARANRAAFLDALNEILAGGKQVF
ncbi:MAG: zinc-ribbon domain-containing protein [Gemmatimonadota bacterium]